MEMGRAVDDLKEVDNVDRGLGNHNGSALERPATGKLTRARFGLRGDYSVMTKGLKGALLCFRIAVSA